MDSGRSSTEGGPATSKPAGAPPELRTICRQCARPVDVTHRFCPHCGARQGQGAAWYYHPVWILVLALAVLGPFALFLVWKSPRMGWTGKILLAAVILAYSGVCVYVLYGLVGLELREMRQLDQVLRQIRSR